MTDCRFGADDKTTIRDAMRRRIRTFNRREDGGMTILTLFLFVTMLIVSGLAVDLMRFETKRVEVQATADRCALAAAALSQKNDPKEVCLSYFEKAGLSAYLDAESIKVSELKQQTPDGNGGFTEEVKARTVTLTTRTEVPTIFLRMVGANEFAANAGAGAAERVTDVEIALIVDASGSMVGSRIANLRDAADEFIDLVLPRAHTADDITKTSISIVPYSMNVSLPPSMEKHFNISDPHAFNNCVLFDDEDFQTTQLPTTQPLERFPHFDHSWGWYHWVDGINRIEKPLCPVTPPGGVSVNALVPPTMDPAPLKQAINTLEPFGATGIDAAMKWGIAMLDPSTKPAIDGMITDGALSPLVGGRPAALSTGTAMKVAVLMTDGNIDGQRSVREPLKSGLSNVWYDPVNQRYSILLNGGPIRRVTGEPGWWNDSYSSDGHWDMRDANAEEDEIWNGEDEEWYWVNRGSGSEGEFRSYPYSQHRNNSDDRNDWDKLNNTLIRLTQPEVFDRFMLGGHNGGDYKRQLYYWPDRRDKITGSEWNIYGNPREDKQTDAGSTSRLLDLCRKARVDGIIVYTIAFEAPGQASRDLMRQCAGVATGNYFDVDGANLTKAFSAIADQIQQLRLTQ